MNLAEALSRPASLLASLLVVLAALRRMGQSSFATVPAAGPTPSAGATQGQEGTQQFERVHARQVRPVQV